MTTLMPLTMTPNELLVWFVSMAFLMTVVFGLGVMAVAHVLPHPHLRSHRAPHRHLP